MTVSSDQDCMSRLRFTSAVPWILVGVPRSSPSDRDDRVLASGGEAGTELVGFVRQQEFSGPSDVADRFAESMLRHPGFGVVTSEAIPATPDARDKRSSAYTFAWEGETRHSSDIEEQFRRSLPDILAALDTGSREDFEWAIARLVFAVHEITAATRRRRRNLIFIVTIEAAVLLVAAVVLALVLR